MKSFILRQSQELPGGALYAFQFESETMTNLIYNKRFFTQILVAGVVINQQVIYNETILLYLRHLRNGRRPLEFQS